MKRQVATVLRVFDECETVKTLEVELSEPISPKPGQCGTFFLLKEDGSFGEGRVYSLSSSPLSKEKISITFRMTPLFPSKLAALKLGDKIGFFGPYGTFVLDESLSSVVFLGGGVGITPLLSMIRYIGGKKLPVNMVLIHSNKTVQITPFLDFFKGLEKRNENFKYVLNLTEPENSEGWEGLKEDGYLSGEMVRKHVPQAESQTFYICGPPPYTKAAVEVLTSIGVPSEKIKLEAW